MQKGSLYSLTESKQALLADALRAGAAAFHAALDAVPEARRLLSGSAWRCEATFASWRASSTRPRSSPARALPEGRAAERGRWPSAAGTSSAGARCSARASSAANSAPTSILRRRRCSSCRPPTGRTPGCDPMRTPCAGGPVHRDPRGRHPRLRLVGRCLRLSYPQVGNPLARIPNRVEAPAARVSARRPLRGRNALLPRKVWVSASADPAAAKRLRRGSRRRPLRGRNALLPRKVWVSASADPRRVEAPTARIPKGVPFGAAILFSPAGGYPLLADTHRGEAPAARNSKGAHFAAGYRFQHLTPLAVVCY